MKLIASAIVGFLSIALGAYIGGGYGGWVFWFLFIGIFAIYSGFSWKSQSVLAAITAAVSSSFALGYFGFYVNWKGKRQVDWSDIPNREYSAIYTCFFVTIAIAVFGNALGKKIRSPKKRGGLRQSQRR